MNELNELIDDNEELYTLVCEGNHADELDLCLKSLPNIDEILMYLYRRSGQCVNLLMLAALYGKDEMIRVILSHSSDVNKLVELHGNVCRINGTFVRNATALWCACDRGHYTVARILIDIGGAKIDHGPRYPLLIDAVIGGRLDTVRFLIENGYANIDNTARNESYKLNSLIMAIIYGHTQIVAFLLEKGAKFDYMTPSSSNTPLGYASIKGHLDIVRLLCTTGACPTTKNKNGQTPLMLAAKYDRMLVVDYLLEQDDIETCIKQLELVACSFVTLTNNSITIHRAQFQRMFNLMRKIFDIRKMKNLSKIISPAIAAYAFRQECQTIEEFNQIQHDHERLSIEVLIIRERLLVPEKNETLFKPLLMYGDKLVERGEFEHCLHLWEHTFYLYQNMEQETGLHRFVWVFCKMLAYNIPISVERFVQISRLTFERSQQKPRDDYIKNALCFLAIAVKILEQSTLRNTERHLIYQWIKDLCRQRRMTSHGQTLLHLCVDRQTYYDINYRARDIKPIINFPNVSIAQLLLTYSSRWIDINAIEFTSGNTALHISTQNDTSDSLAVVQLLLNSGAHIDSLNINNQTPFDVAQTIEIRNLLKNATIPIPIEMSLCTIDCGETIIVRIHMAEETDMNKFLFLHGVLAKQGKTSSKYHLCMLDDDE